MRIGRAALAIAVGLSVAACTVGTVASPSPLRPRRSHVRLGETLMAPSVGPMRIDRDRQTPPGELRVFQGGERWGPATGPDPLFVVDGVRMSRKAVRLIKPGRIADVTILKAAFGVEQYGSGGVVLIRTRK